MATAQETEGGAEAEHEALAALPPPAFFHAVSSKSGVGLAKLAFKIRQLFDRAEQYEEDAVG